MLQGSFHRLLAVLLFCLALAVPAGAEVDSVFRDFKPTGELLFELDGVVQDSVTLYMSDRSRSYLLMGPELGSPLLIQPSAGTVEKVSLMKVQKAEDGTVDLLADAAFEQAARFRIDGTKIVFEHKGQEAVLRPKPPLVGLQTADALRDYKPEYGDVADAYEPNAGAVEALAAQSREVTVRVFLGTWCPVCGRVVPNVMKTDEALQTLGGSSLNFEYYGLPRNISEDPLAAEMDIHGVPTVVVLAGDKEIGRIDARKLVSPETALRELLGS